MASYIECGSGFHLIKTLVKILTTTFWVLFGISVNKASVLANFSNVVFEQAGFCSLFKA